MTTASFDLFPWRPEQEPTTEAGRLLRKAVDAAQARADQIGPDHWRYTADTDDGAATFGAIGIPRAAGEAGVWYEDVDDGIRQVQIPSGPTMEFPVDVDTGETLLTDSTWATMHHAGRLGDRVDAYFSLANSTLAEIADLEVGTRGRLFCLAFPR